MRSADWGRRHGFVSRDSIGRFKPANFDVAMSGEGSAAAVGRVQFYARTRPEAGIEAYSFGAQLGREAGEP